MCVFTSSTYCYICTRGIHTLNLKISQKRFWNPQRYYLSPTTRFKYLTHGSFELICTEVIFRVTNFSDKEQEFLLWNSDQVIVTGPY